MAVSLLELSLGDVGSLSVLRLFRLVSVTSSYLHLHLHLLCHLTRFLVSSPVFLVVSLPPSPHLCVSFLCFVQLRVFRLVRWWCWFHQFLQITLKHSFLLLIVFLGFVTIGYQLFHGNYRTSVCKISVDCRLPRWHMDSFFHTFLVVFGAFSGVWMESLWDCMEVSGQALCLTFFLSAVIMGNLLVSLCRWILPDSCVVPTWCFPSKIPLLSGSGLTPLPDVTAQPAQPRC